MSPTEPPASSLRPTADPTADPTAATTAATTADPTATGRRRGGRSLLAILGFGGVTAGAAALGAVAVGGPDTQERYERWEKPPFAPPAGVFGPVWTVLYACIAASGWRVWRAEASPARTRALALWGVQLGLNAAWTPLFFGGERGVAALVDVVALDVTVAAYARQAWKVDRVAALLVLPYLAWTLFATALNAELVRRNEDLR